MSKSRKSRVGWIWRSHQCAAVVVCLVFAHSKNAQPIYFNAQTLHQDSSGVSGVAEFGDRFGYAVAVGDFDNDGYDDLAIGAPDEAFGNELDLVIASLFRDLPDGSVAQADVVQVLYAEDPANGA